MAGEGCEPVDGKVADPHDEDGDVDGQDPQHHDEDRVRVVVEVVVCVGARVARQPVRPRACRHLNDAEYHIREVVRYHGGDEHEEDAGGDDSLPGGGYGKGGGGPSASGLD